MSYFWTPARDERLRQLWVGNTSLSDLRDELGRIGIAPTRPVSRSYLSQRAKALGLPTRWNARNLAANGKAPLMDPSRSHNIELHASAYLTDAARKRGLTLNQLARRLMLIIERDRMVDAVLDDADTVRQLSQPESAESARG